MLAMADTDSEHITRPPTVIHSQDNLNTPNKEFDIPNNFNDSPETPFALPWQERLVIASVMVIGFFTSFEAVGVGPPLPVCVPFIMNHVQLDQR